MSITPLTPEERLALSRKAILKYMNRNNRNHEHEMGLDADPTNSHNPAKGGRLSTLRQAIRVWWFRQPASSAIELARPLLGDYAKAHPFKLLGVAACVGASAVLIRPWRMVSVGGLLVAAVKSSGLSGVLLSLLTHRSQNNQDTP